MKKIRELRQEKGLTQNELAQILGVNQTAIGKYERGELEPDIEKLKVLSNFFDVTVDYILELEDDFGVRSSNAELSSEEWDIVRSYRSLNPACKDLIKSTLGTLLSNASEKRKDI
ncbi:MAG: helix-turn-helix domain-containing protein [Clostridia bacterium]|nr:helix-turn-helix domain-containing protein [Clostridia bacterium]